MNLSTIAKLAEVSVSTVSKAFSGSEEISERTKEKIFEIARQNGCFEKYFKHKYDKKVIGVIYPEVLGGSYPVIMELLDRLIRERGGLMVASATGFSEERRRELFNYYSTYGNVDGIIVMSSYKGLSSNTGVPFVALFDRGRNDKVDAIQCDVRASMVEAVKCLKEYGHTRIGFAGEKLTRGRVEDYRYAMKKAGLYIRASDIKISNKRFEEAGIESMDSWLEEKDPPTAILAAYDNIAMGVIKSIRKKGLRVPEDFSVIGIDDMPLAPYTDTSLSSIRTFREEACRMAVDLLMKKIDNQYYTSPREMIIASELVLRDSVGRCMKQEEE